MRIPEWYFIYSTYFANPCDDCMDHVVFLSTTGSIWILKLIFVCYNRTFVYFFEKERAAVEKLTLFGLTEQF